jgi:hypothetical protein
VRGEDLIIEIVVQPGRFRRTVVFAFTVTFFRPRVGPDIDCRRFHLSKDTTFDMAQAQDINDHDAAYARRARVQNVAVREVTSGDNSSVQHAVSIFFTSPVNPRSNSIQPLTTARAGRAPCLLVSCVTSMAIASAAQLVFFVCCPNPRSESHLSEWRASKIARSSIPHGTPLADSPREPRFCKEIE